LKKKSKIYFVATVDFAVNAFLLNHLRTLSEHFDLAVIVNTKNKNLLHEQGINARIISLSFHRKINPVYDIHCLISLIYIFFRDRPHAVHSITPKAGLLAMLAAFVTARPLKVHTFTGQVWANKKSVSRFILKKLDFFTGLFADFNIVDSPSQRDFLVEEGVLDLSKTIVFGSGSVSGVDLNRFKKNKKESNSVRKDLKIPDDAFVFIYLGRLTREKGVFELTEAFSNLNNNSYLVFVGPDEDDFQIQINAFRLINLDRVRFVGLSNVPERYLAASDVLCLPSYREGFGSVIIEAAAMGIPAIASNIYGISDAVVNGQTGLLHKAKDISEIKSCMDKLIQFPDLVAKLGANAQVRAKKLFDAKLISAHWLDFYLSKLNSNENIK
jgi:glycosyltransferase involved in cell wall biosynthesis